MYCREHRRAQVTESPLSTPLPGRPWKNIGADLCEHNKQHFLVLSDYYSRYLEILNMTTTTSEQVTLKLRAIIPLMAYQRRMLVTMDHSLAVLSLKILHVTWTLNTQPLVLIIHSAMTC